MLVVTLWDLSSLLTLVIHIIYIGGAVVSSVAMIPRRRTHCLKLVRGTPRQCRIKTRRPLQSTQLWWVAAFVVAGYWWFTVSCGVKWIWPPSYSKNHGLRTITFGWFPNGKRFSWDLPLPLLPLQTTDEPAHNVPLFTVIFRRSAFISLFVINEQNLKNFLAFTKKFYFVPSTSQSHK